uniref:Secreted protein n=1 Tax=Anguilla anguilla TaxID=7936 RepID=A0A0E9XI81_ANGAN
MQHIRKTLFFTLLWVLFNILEQRFNAFTLPTCATSVLLYLCISAYGEAEHVVSEQWYLCQYSIYIFFLPECLSKI